MIDQLQNKIEKFIKDSDSYNKDYLTSCFQEIFEKLNCHNFKKIDYNPFPKVSHDWKALKCTKCNLGILHTVEMRVQLYKEVFEIRSGLVWPPSAHIHVVLNQCDKYFINNYKLNFKKFIEFAKNNTCTIRCMKLACN